MHNLILKTVLIINFFLYKIVFFRCNKSDFQVFIIIFIFDYLKIFIFGAEGIIRFF